MEDMFAKIAQGYNKSADRGLSFYKPPKVNKESVVSLNKDNHIIMPEYNALSTKEELSQEIVHLREQYNTYLKDYAPEIKEPVKRIALKEFQVSEDNKESYTVTIPYYNGPVGPAVQKYTTHFVLEDFANDLVFICFRGVDYIAEVYINGCYVGSHEGFFSPFEIDITSQAIVGINTLEVVVKNDWTMTLNKTGSSAISGDKIYAATGPGWDDPMLGWHHCPAGMGIYQDVYLEVRKREWISDIFVREGNELWIECGSADWDLKEISFLVSLYGQNFEYTLYENKEFIPTTVIHSGVGDTLTEADLKAQGLLGNNIRLFLEKGYNRFVFPLDLPNPRIWEPDNPWLYQVQVSLVYQGEVKSVKKRQFGVRSFSQDITDTPKGKFYLNNKQIKLRGANTMGYEQQDVMRGDFEQLIEDILLAKACNMNFLRITQRPVQEEIYDYCDRLGMMVQTDMPLFGEVRINQFCEVLRQTEEMEKLIRSHPSCILVSYINEPFPNANNLPHRMISRKDMEEMFKAMDTVIHLHNPERVIKYVDGDYDPPSKGMPDNHCYTMWYNGHGIDMGQLHKGHWLAVKPDWYFGCGEFGAEGLDFVETMQQDYPQEWIKEPFHPQNILRAQTGSFYHFFFDEEDSIEDWINKSQSYQAFATKIMTTAFRRNDRMNSFAIHLFIDAWPAGWMKAIMDCKRNPKSAFFMYRDKLSPVMADIRSDRFSFFEGERVQLESYVCNDLEDSTVTVKYRAELLDQNSTANEENPNEAHSENCLEDGHTYIIGSEQKQWDLSACSNKFAGLVTFEIPTLCHDFDKVKLLHGKKENEISTLQLKVEMTVEQEEKVLHKTEEYFTVYPKVDCKTLETITWKEVMEEKTLQEIYSGRHVVLAPLEVGEYHLYNYKIAVKPCGMDPVYFVSRKTGHKLVEGFSEKSFAYWYDDTLDRLAPITTTTLVVEQEANSPSGRQIENGFVKNILISGNKAVNGDWQKESVCAELTLGAGSIIFCQIDFNNFMQNPVAVIFRNRLSDYSNNFKCQEE